MKQDFLQKLEDHVKVWANIEKEKNIGPGGGFLTRVLEKLFGKLKTFRKQTCCMTYFATFMQILKTNQDIALLHPCGYHLLRETSP